ncbi:Elongation factor Tu domain 2 [uncultured archaeon]|nr:Elongation factor Tu domain 2 [uncultured archaeon]
MDDIDDAVESINAREERKTSAAQRSWASSNKVQVGSVEMFFDRVGVAAILLEGELKVGDIIEIGNEEDAIRQRVTSMQIDRQNVTGAGPGDSVGIKVKCAVQKGSMVCKIE